MMKMMREKGTEKVVSLMSFRRRKRRNIYKYIYIFVNQAWKP